MTDCKVQPENATLRGPQSSVDRRDRNPNYQLHHVSRPTKYSLDTNQRQQNDTDQGQQNGQIRPWDPGIRLAEEPDSDHQSTTSSGTSGLQVQSLTR